MDKLRIGIIGTGQRGCAYMERASRHPECELVALCDSNAARMNEFAQKQHLDHVMKFTDAEEMLSVGLIDVCIICVPDYLHESMAIAAISHDIHVMLEKPMALTTTGCDNIIAALKKHPVVLQVGFVLRETIFYKTLKQLVSEGRLGRLMSIQADESLAVMHGASYMRRWHRLSCNCGGFILTKCSHDLDILNWLADSTPASVASFGSLDYFKTDISRPSHCSKCDDYQCRFRFHGDFVVMTDQEAANPVKYDLCVYNADKDTVDNQTAIIAYENGVKASFNLNLFSKNGRRFIKLVGTNGYAEGNNEDCQIHITYSDGRPDETIDCHPLNDSGHGGGDENFFNELIHCIRTGTRPHADYQAGRISTALGNAIEQSRREHKIIDLNF